jgi:hypothetical protein
MAAKLPVKFQPAELRPRHDGWTAEKQIAFLEALAETASVDHACRRVGMSRQSAYRLRRDLRAETFRDGWDNALDHALHQLEEAALSRAVHGVPRPIFYKGEQVGETRDYDERLTMFLLRSRRPHRFGKWFDRLIPPDLDPSRDFYDRPSDPTWRLNQNMEFIPDETPDEGFDVGPDAGPQVEPKADE